ncbi:D-glucuronyl C5-epimerase, partial [Trichinella britovi]
MSLKRLKFVSAVCLTICFALGYKLFLICDRFNNWDVERRKIFYFTPSPVMELPGVYSESKVLAMEDDVLPVVCQINGKRTVRCLEDVEHGEVYMPFKSFLQPYFDVYGTLKKSENGSTFFDFQHSFAKIQQPSFSTYRADSVFGQFGTYNVAERFRVRCINSKSGVPMSVQWSQRGYYYPVQIGQYGLEHYSRSIIEPMPHVQYIAGLSEKRCFVEGQQTITIQNSSELSVLRMFVLSSDQESSFHITVQRSDTKQLYRIHYIPAAEPIRVINSFDVYFGFGQLPKNRWIRFTRDLSVDLMHGIGYTSKRMKKVKLKAIKLVILQLAFAGELCVANVSLQTHAHVDHFLDVANWFVENQDGKGGWSVPVKRSMSNGRLVLKPGWYSAMAQGHAMSVLCRAYLLENKKEYLDSALKAVQLFYINASDGGLINYFYNVFPWYEEYPTTPGSFVLNGFIYSLIGLRDLAFCSERVNQQVLDIYKIGLNSLKNMLPLYDTGVGSLYDLRHVSLHGAPNVARWDYHAVHIFQLHWLYIIEGDELFKETANRWIRFSEALLQNSSARCSYPILSLPMIYCYVDVIFWLWQFSYQNTDKECCLQIDQWGRLEIMESDFVERFNSLRINTPRQDELKQQCSLFCCITCGLIEKNEFTALRCLLLTCHMEKWLVRNGFDVQVVMLCPKVSSWFSDFGILETKFNNEIFISKSLNCAEICRMNKDELFSTVGKYFQTYQRKENAIFIIFSDLKGYNFQQLSRYFQNMQFVNYAYKIAHVKISIAQFSVKCFLSERKKQIFERIKEKHGKVDSQDQIVSRLTALVVVFELLTAKHDQPVFISYPSENGLPEIARKALFVMYNFTRMCSILNSFKKMVSTNYYPKLVPLALLSSDMQRGVLAEFRPLTDMIFSFDIIHSGNGSRRSDFTVPKICHWLTNFTSQFSKIYSKIQILTPATDLLFDELFVKIHLIEMFHNTMKLMFNLLCLETLNGM